MKPAFTSLTVCGLEELESHGARGVTHVLSIIDPDLADPDVFGRYQPHERTLLRFHDAIEPEPNIVLPTREDVDAILAFGRALDTDREGHLLIHCHMGISRSTAAMTMLLAQAHPDEGEEAVVDRVLAVRPIAWPNSRMVRFADEALGRRGRLLDAVSRIYARSMAHRPDLAETFTRLNRAHEVALGRNHPAHGAAAAALPGG